MIGTTITHYRIIETLGDVPIRPANVISVSRCRVEFARLHWSKKAGAIPPLCGGR